MSDNEEIEQIRSSLEKLEKHVLDIIDDLHKRIDSLETGPEIVTDTALDANPIDNNEREHRPTEPPQTPYSRPARSTNSFIRKPQSIDQGDRVGPPPPRPPGQGDRVGPPPPRPTGKGDWAGPPPPRQSPEWLVETKGFIWSFLLVRLGPISELWGMLVSTYQHYREQGKTTSFILTLFGILALVVGFGYLLQFTFINLFGDLAKILTGAIFSTTVLFIGIQLSRKGSNYSEYASSILATAIVLYYMCIFFSAFYYDLISETASFVLFALTTFFGLGISLFYDTRIVAVITLLGGSFAPFLVSTDSMAITHLSFQLLLTLGIVGLNLKLRWDRLLQLSFTVSLIVFESYFLSGYHDPLMIWHILGLFYIFSILMLGPWRNQFKAIDLQIVVFNLVLFVFSCWQIFLEADITGQIFLANALIFAFAFIVYRWIRSTPELQALVLLYAATLTAVGIFALAQVDLFGLLWGGEGVLLLVLGLHFRITYIRWEGLVAIALGILASTYSLLVWLIFGNTGNPWLLLISAGLVLVISHLSIKRSRDKITKSESIPVTLISEGISIWFTVAVLTATYILWPTYISSMAIPVAMALLYRSARNGSTFTHNFALCHLGLAFIGIVLGAFQTGDFMFRTLPQYAKINLLEIAIFAWGLQWFYEKMDRDFHFIKFAVYIRQAFYLALPVFILPRVWRSYVDWFPIALWGSSIASVILYKVVRSKPQQVESTVLLILAAIVSFIAIVANTPSNYSLQHSALILATGLAVTGFISFLSGAMRQIDSLEAPYSTSTLVLFHYIAAGLFLAASNFSGNPAIGLGLTSLVYAVYFRQGDHLRPLRRMLKASYLLVFISMFFQTLLLMYPLRTSSTGLADVIGCLLAVSVLVYIMYGTFPTNRLAKSWFLPQRAKLWITHLFVITVYLSGNYVLLGDAFGPVSTFCLVIHATAILFTTLKPPWKQTIEIAWFIYALAVIKIFALDLGDFSVPEKMVAFIGIGIVLLAAAFQFQRLRTSVEVKTPT